MFSLGKAFWRAAREYLKNLLIALLVDRNSQK